MFQGHGLLPLAIDLSKRELNVIDPVLSARASNLGFWWIKLPGNFNRITKISKDKYFFLIHVFHIGLAD